MAGIDRWLHYTVTTIDRFHCILCEIHVIENCKNRYMHEESWLIDACIQCHVENL